MVGEYTTKAMGIGRKESGRITSIMESSFIITVMGKWRKGYMKMEKQLRKYDMIM